MKNLYYLLAIVFLVACDSDDSGDTADTQKTTDTFVLDATGVLAEQTVEEAKKIVFGRWNMSTTANTISGSVSSSQQIANTSTCDFDYIEFTEDNYLMGFIFNGNPETAFGHYKLNEDSNGFVSSVDLFMEDDSEAFKIATLTDIVVTESSTQLTATFSIELFIPEESEYNICNNTQGDYTALKAEPMDESDSASVDSNHSLFVNSWELESVYVDGQDMTSEFLSRPCEYYDTYLDTDTLIDGCELASSLILSVSAYGTYTFVYMGSSEGILVQTDTWSWVDESQTAFYVDSGTQLITVESLTETQGVFSTKSDEGTEVFTFNKI